MNVPCGIEWRVVLCKQEEDRDPESEFRDIAKYGIVQVAGIPDFTTISAWFKELR